MSSHRTDKPIRGSPVPGSSWALLYGFSGMVCGWPSSQVNISENSISLRPWDTNTRHHKHPLTSSLLLSLSWVFMPRSPVYKRLFQLRDKCDKFLMCLLSCLKRFPFFSVLRTILLPWFPGWATTAEMPLVKSPFAFSELWQFLSALLSLPPTCHCSFFPEALIYMF